jgi:hypothetical protein
VWVKGCVAVALICRFFDTWVIDACYNLLAKGTERFAAFTGIVLDNLGVDGAINGVASNSFRISDFLRSPQTGRIRNYVMFAAMVAAVVLVMLVFRPEAGEAAGAAVASLGG